MQAIPVTAEIARRAAAMAWRDLPQDLVERTKQCLLDWFAVTVAGAREELTEILIREAMEDGAKGPASLVGRSEKVLPSTAALINGAASHALDSARLPVRRKCRRDSWGRSMHHLVLIIVGSSSNRSRYIGWSA